MQYLCHYSDNLVRKFIQSSISWSHDSWHMSLFLLFSQCEIFKYEFKHESSGDSQGIQCEDFSHSSKPTLWEFSYIHKFIIYPAVLLKFNIGECVIFRSCLGTISWWSIILLIRFLSIQGCCQDKLGFQIQFVESEWKFHHLKPTHNTSFMDPH